MNNLPLSGIRVLDAGEYVSGPYCAKLLASYGAEVIKIESPAGDMSRRCGPFPGDIPDPERSGLFLYLNSGKKGITLNRETAAGTGLLHRLAAVADILVENGSPGTPDLNAIQAANPSLLVASISYFGPDGPYRGFKGADIVAQALGGVMKLTGRPDREPLKIAGPQAEYQAGINAAIAILAALFLRDETGSGQRIDISVMECVASILEGSLLSQAYNGTVRERSGARHPTVYPSTILPCRDGWIHVDASTDWENFTRFLEMPELLEFRPEELRQQANEIDAHLAPVLANKDRGDLFHQAQGWRLPFAPVLGIEELPQDEQLESRGFFTAVDHPATGRLSCPGPPFQASEMRPEAGRPPRLGEHNAAVYGELLDISGPELVRRRRVGII